MAEFASDEHIASMSYEELESFCRYMWRKCQTLELVLKMYREENARLRKKVENQTQNIRGLSCRLERIAR